jgi:sterol desaturase/sphingolipid hydroxylase (fatty acid hydroxylase superfamily)
MVLIYDVDVPNEELKQPIVSSIKNQILYTLPLTITFNNYYPIVYDNVLTSIVYYPVLIVLSDVYFYVSHIPLHSRYLYNIHKHHHKGTLCVSKSLDANGFEHVFGNLGSFMCGILLLWYLNIILNYYVIVSWVASVTVNTCISHSNNKCILDNGSHFNHHKNRNCNYGFGFYIMDRIMNTYKK